MFYLCRCVLLGGKAKPSKIETFDLDAIYEMCQHNSLTAMVCEALQQSGIEVDQKWKDAYAKSLRKNMLLDAERSKIFDMLDKNKIWHIALKGVHMKNYYPSMGMRQMADNDILYDSSRQNDVTSIFTELGYNADSIGKSHHYVYFKEPIYNFESCVGCHHLCGNSDGSVECKHGFERVCFNGGFELKNSEIILSNGGQR